MNHTSVLLIEPFYGGSHKVLIDRLMEALRNANIVTTLCTMKAKKWHWRARTSALYFSEVIPLQRHFTALFASSVLNLAELVALRPDLKDITKIYFFHENQLVYPVREYKDRDFQYGYNQIISCLVADVIVFNSNYNKTSFLESLKKFFSVQPDYRPKNLKERILNKCRVIYLPLPLVSEIQPRNYSQPIHIVWPHRWEHDKDPGAMFDILKQLVVSKSSFMVSLVGEQFSEELEDFKDAKEMLKGHIVHWGYLDIDTYYSLLDSADIIVSTALHEFFGIAMLEGTMRGCFPLCPNRLVYPEIYPKQCLYESSQDLFHKLQSFCDDPTSLKLSVEELSMDFSRFDMDELLPQYVKLFLS